jgi:hypothetical protein
MAEGAFRTELVQKCLSLRESIVVYATLKEFLPASGDFLLG